MSFGNPSNGGMTFQDTSNSKSDKDDPDKKHNELNLYQYKFNVEQIDGKVSITATEVAAYKE